MIPWAIMPGMGRTQDFQAARKVMATKPNLEKAFNYIMRRRYNEQKQRSTKDASSVHVF